MELVIVREIQDISWLAAQCLAQFADDRERGLMASGGIALGRRLEFCERAVRDPGFLGESLSATDPTDFHQSFDLRPHQDNGHRGVHGKSLLIKFDLRNTYKR